MRPGQARQPIPGRTAHRSIADHLSGLLLRTASWSIALIFVIDAAGELLDGDETLLPRWYVYALALALTLWLRRRRASAQPIVIAASGFLAIACIAMWWFGVDIASADAVTSVAVIAVLGMIGTVLRPGRGVGILAFFSFLAGITAYATAAIEGSSLDDAMVRTAASTAVVVLGGWSLRTMRDRLEEVISSKDAFLASVSHELRTPLTSIVGFAMTLEESGAELGDSHAQELVSHIASQSREMADLVEDLLVAARADLGTLSISMGSVVLCDVACDVVETARHVGLAEGKELRIDGTTAPAVGDDLRCRQIIRNLVTNALRYGGDVVTVRGSTGPTMAHLDVIDNGTGLGADEADRIFEPYYRARQAPSQPGSVGLGLAVSRQLARMMGGEVSIERTAGETRFRLSMPLRATRTGAPTKVSAGEAVTMQPSVV